MGATSNMHGRDKRTHKILLGKKRDRLGDLHTDLRIKQKWIFKKYHEMV
jgi:hypothetical protein